MNSNLVSIIRNSLAAAQAALDLIEVTQTALVSAAPAPTPFAETALNNAVQVINEAWGQVPVPQTPAAPELTSPFETLMRELNDPRYTLRSTYELAEKTGLPDYHIKDELFNNEVEYVVKHRRSDGAELVGLASRN